MCVNRDQRTTCEGQLSPSTLWVPKIECKSSLTLQSYLAGLKIENFKRGNMNTPRLIICD